jgi:hypothetical protein
MLGCINHFTCCFDCHRQLGRDVRDTQHREQTARQYGRPSSHAPRGPDEIVNVKV